MAQTLATFSNASFGSARPVWDECRDAVAGVMRPILTVINGSEAQFLAGVKVMFLGDAALAPVVGMARDMGAATVTAEPAAQPRRGLDADIVVVSHPSTAAEIQTWQQVARMKIDNPNLVVVLVDWTNGRVPAPHHDVAVPHPAQRDALRDAFSEAKRLLRVATVEARNLPVKAAAAPLFRKPATRNTRLFA